jgi:hypothetical protein
MRLNRQCTGATAGAHPRPSSQPFFNAANILSGVIGN